MNEKEPPRPLWAVRLRAEREARGWGRRKMARQLLGTIGAPLEETRISSLSRQLQHWERGLHFPRDWASWLAETLGVDETDLFGSAHTLPSFGKTMYRFMARQQTRLTDLAEQLGIDVAELARISDGLVPPSPELARSLDSLLITGGKLAALTPGTAAEPESEPEAEPPSTVETPDSPDDWDDMERRRMLQATLGIGAAALTPDSIRHFADMALAAEPRDLDEWHLACVDHLHAVRTRPPAQARQDILIDLIALDRQFKNVSSGDRVEWQRVKAAMATLHANVLTRLGEHGNAIRWWRTARAAADATGDRELQLGVRATETGHARYGQRAPETVLRLTKDAYRFTSDRPTLGKALVTCSDVKALAAVGRQADARNALNACEDLFATAEKPPTIMSDYWTGGQLEFTRLIVHAHEGNEPQVQAALDRSLAVLSRTSDHHYVPQNQLYAALCAIVNGGIDTGVRQAATTLEALAPQHRTHMVTETGNMVLRVVPSDQRERPAVREFREVLVKTAPKPALTA